MRRINLILYCLLLTSSVFADDIAGIWKGTLTQGPGGCYPHYFLELQISISNDRITGKAYDYYDKEHFVKMSFTGRYNPQTRRLVLIEETILQQDIPSECSPCIKTYELNYSRDGSDEMLIGDWKGIMQDKRFTCPPGRIFLKKSAVSDFPAEVVQNDTLEAIQKQLRLQPRTTEIVKSITVNSSRIKVELYDNGEIDHDTVTVLINGKLVLYRKMLTDRPLTLEFSAIPGMEYEVVMYADNLGDIPPNTALMMVTAGTRKIEAFLSSSEQKSAAVHIVYKPD
jgi:hypothetical protein